MSATVRIKPLNRSRFAGTELDIATIGQKAPPKDAELAKIAELMGGGEEVNLEVQEMSENPGIPEVQAETTSVFRADLLKEMESGAGSSPTATSADNLPEGSALLIVKRGPNAGSRFLLDRETTTAGRHPESDIFLDDVTVSRRHAEFRLNDGEFEVVDVGSLNGTYVNRERVDSVELRAGDEVQIGKYRLTYQPSTKQA